MVLTAGGFCVVSMNPMTGLAIVTVADEYVPVGTALRSRSWCRPLN